eukprot:2345080-Prymnesium_polylepis.1
MFRRREGDLLRSCGKSISLDVLELAVYCSSAHASSSLAISLPPLIHSPTAPFGKVQCSAAYRSASRSTAASAPPHP